MTRETLLARRGCLSPPGTRARGQAGCIHRDSHYNRRRPPDRRNAYTCVDARRPSRLQALRDWNECHWKWQNLTTEARGRTNVLVREMNFATGTDPGNLVIDPLNVWSAYQELVGPAESQIYLRGISAA